MNIDSTAIAIALFASILSGMGTALIAAKVESKKEQSRQIERYQDNLKMELKDLKIHLYEIEKELDAWKEKYYTAVQQLIEVKAELEDTIIKLSLIHLENMEEA
jgi:septal ring factor EnvC (AmiA/AmiB activator)